MERRPRETSLRSRGRRGNAEARQRAVLDAALEVFLAKGFAAARLDDIAARAGVAKGTIYLYFRDKEHLFQALLREAVGPVITRVEGLLPSFAGSTGDLLHMIAELMDREILQTRRKDLLRLIIAEGPRFPWLSEFYWREVVSRGLAIIRAVGARAVARGEFASDALERFPQLLPAPMLVAVIWGALFDRFDKLDTRALLDAHVDILVRGLARRDS
ncbi:TetR/AcrR family transcriptional regulator [Chelatococcus sp. SYSU_G07232]|uniref:TetR/AcrR family transcriptional regulator n=1 Tax=Chelatococcus albus TaxID=3047466 RepID=A0ABT7AG89_9HYPH|nr:TetR/AcrR family transcriptional regulator [Chelatococcus sp. SYSU_G07232]MDJ1158385.1 TetR/AcrR family transcriptional regulator [Chelatococcus sp. SYSU_G07232]